MREFDERLPSRKSLAKNFFGPFPREIARHKTFSAHFLGKSAATKLFRLISSGNRPPQNFFGSFPQEIGRHKTFRLISSGNRPPQTFSAHFLRKSVATKLFQLISSGNRPLTYSLISSGNRWMVFHSFPEEIGRMWIASVSNSRYAEGRPTSTERGVVNGGGSAPQAR